MGDLTAAIDQIAAILSEPEILGYFEEFTRAASKVACALEDRGLDDASIAAALSGHLAEQIVVSVKGKP